jgi:hypothetical protein
LTDFLGSDEPRAGTVDAGYGAAIEQREFIEGQWVPQRGSFLTAQRGLSSRCRMSAVSNPHSGTAF